MNAEHTDRLNRQGAERADNRSHDCEVRNIQKGRHSTNVDFEQTDKGGTQMTQQTDKHTFC